ncbi:unnamed protein product [Pleuronectes platessa]|uniref:Uncharacterized protein n=1 Tax=Pleuronectes platessa TaxID=8262 RepID=A0A9N7YGE9_PLEPL|nr:unnamed protein product [Pleuronectes platessa]
MPDTAKAGGVRRTGNPGVTNTPGNEQPSPLCRARHLPVIALERCCQFFDISELTVTPTSPTNKQEMICRAPWQEMEAGIRVSGQDRWAESTLAEALGFHSLTQNLFVTSYFQRVARGHFRVSQPAVLCSHTGVNPLMTGRAL